MLYMYACSGHCLQDMLQYLDEQKPNNMSSFHQECCRIENIGRTLTIVNGNTIKLFFCSRSFLSTCVIANTSCYSIYYHYPSASSGYYTITPDYKKTVVVYCDMDGDNCDSNGGWTRVAFINMTVPDINCPNGLSQLTFEKASNPVCGVNNYLQTGCDSSYFDTILANGITKVCGFVRGYQFGSTSAFVPGKSLESVYLDGVSITFGSPRRHIWSYVSGWGNECPCNNNAKSPNFVKNHYYCETAVIGNIVVPDIYSNDPLWDGLNCDSNSYTSEVKCCDNTTNMPWFVREFDQIITDGYIELRMCNTQYANTLVDIIELYIQ